MGTTTLDDIATPETPAEIAPTDASWTFVLERLLDDGERLDDALVDDDTRADALPRMLSVAIVGLLLFGLPVGLTAEMAALGEGTPLLWIPLSLTGGFLTAIAVGLPSFYFYTQLAGVDASFRLVTAQAVRVQARTSVLLLGVLPFYAAIALSSVLDIGWLNALMTSFLGVGAIDTPAEIAVAIGIALPFVIGFFGLFSVYRSFRRLLDVLPVTHERRGNVLMRMLLLWGALAATVAPVAMYRIAEWLMTVT